MAKKPLPTVLIGLGGTGAWTLVHVKKQLLDTYDNVIPDTITIAVLDTAKESVAYLGSHDVVRKPGMGTGRVELESKEYGHVGGNAHSLVQRIAEGSDDYDHIRHWFDSKYYLSNLPQNMFDLAQGAGQFRQFGRFAIFRDLITPATSTMERMLSQKLVEINGKDPDAGGINVILVGSLVGGTGAGLFLDVPHILRLVAKDHNVRNLTVQGFFYLPQAFQGTLKNSSELNQAKTRSAAALRELDRFLLNEDYKVGYPMWYLSPRMGVQDAIYRGYQTDKLYDYVYLVDGQFNDLNQRPIRDGMASVVADAIVNFIDRDYGNEHNQYALNLRAQMTNQWSKIGKRSFVSSLGAYSIILPVQQIIEEWSHKLVLDFLRHLLPTEPEQVTNKGYILALSEAGNPAHLDGNIDRELKRLLVDRTPIVDTRTDEHREILPLSLWRQAWLYFEKNQESEAALHQELGTYRLRNWMELIAPESVTSDPQMTRLVQETRGILREKLDDSETGKPSNERNPKGDPSVDYTSIQSSAERYIAQQLGPQISGGGRSGGKFGDALSRFQGLQIERFNDYVMAYIAETLNGGSEADPIMALTGKLGWLQATMRRWESVYSTVYQIFEEIRSGRGDAERDDRARLTDSLGRLYKEMVENSSETGLFKGNKATNAQRSYIDAVQRFVDFYRMEFARNSVMNTVRAMRDVLRQATTALDNWAKVLATDENSLYTRIMNGERRVQTERGSAEQVKNHQMVNDPEWEARKYDEVLKMNEGEAKLALFKGWYWNCTFQNGNIVVTAQVEGAEGKQSFAISGDRNQYDWADNNETQVLEIARWYFRKQIVNLNIVSYLMDKYPLKRLEELARDLKQKSGSLLAVDAQGLASGRSIRDDILAPRPSNEPAYNEWLNTLRDSLEATQGNNSGSTTATLHVINDPFRLTLLSLTDLIPLDAVNAYNDCKVEYLKLAKDDRQHTHIFPAEVNSVKYEELLPKYLKVDKRQFEHRVSLLLEDERRFLDFLELFVFGVIFRIQNEEASNVEHLWVLQAPERSERRAGQLETWWLSTSSADNPRLLEAAQSYCIVGKDARHHVGVATRVISNPIDYNHIIEYLDEVRKKELEIRLGRDQFAVRPLLDNNGQPILDDEGYMIPDYDVNLRKWLEFFMIEGDFEDNYHMVEEMTPQERKAFYEVAELVVRHDKLQELADWLLNRTRSLEQELIGLKKQVMTNADHNATQIGQEDYDLYSIAYIGVVSEMDRLRKVVKGFYNRASNTNSYDD